MVLPRSLEEELDKRHAVARVAFLNRDIAAYGALFSPNLAYQQVDGSVIGRRQLLNDVEVQFRRGYKATWHFSREDLKVDGDEIIETLVQLGTIEASAFGLIHRSWRLNRRAAYVWTKVTGIWMITRVKVFSEELKHSGWRFGFGRR
ncbi:nuclear transport factor 2 family protein [Oryzifoliimicrobium ureilyticus]|uniref:nuclear transport factor 2 family protein n=1 Tax=Oryzifoliimicrobium ureilyticus TaxID=3113724 RepID=UPI003075FA4F